MNTVTQIIVTTALSLAVAAGFNPAVQVDVQHAAQSAEAAITQAVNLSAQTNANASANSGLQISTAANSSANASSGFNLTTLLNRVLGTQAQAGTGSNVQASGQGQLNLDLNLASGK